MLTPAILIIGLLASTAVIAYWSDNLGKKLGKKRVTLFNLRPRTTATLLTVASSWVIMLFTLAVLLGIFRPLREALTRYDREKADNRDLRATNQKLQKGVQQLQTQEAELLDEVKGVRAELNTSKSLLVTAQSRATQAQTNAERANRSAQKARQGEKQAREKEKLAQQREAGARRAEEQARTAAGVARGREVTARQNEVSARQGAAQARQQLAEARGKLQQKRLQFAGVNTQLTNAQSTLRSARTQLNAARTTLNQTRASLTTVKRDFQTANNAVKAQMKQVEKLETLVAQLEFNEKQLRESAEQLRQAVQDREQAYNALDEKYRQAEVRAWLVSTGRTTIPFNLTFARRTVPVGQSSSARLALLQDLLAEARRTARQAFQLPLQLRRVPVKTEGEPLTLTEEQIINMVGDYLPEFNVPTEVRVVSSRDHAEGEPTIDAIFSVVPVRVAIPSGEILAQETIDGRQSEAQIFSRLQKLVDAGRQFAERERNVQPAFTAQSPNFYVAGTNERYFDALRRIQAAKGPVRVRMVAAADLSTTEALRVRFEVGDGSV
jgi:uncharacterized protein (DUF3084 family)